MTVLVTGGYGHIGAWVSRALLDRGEDVLILGRSRHTVAHLEGFEGRLEFFRGDVLDYASLFRMFKQYDGKIEGIVHIAGLMGGPHFATNPHFNIRTNTFGTLDMLEAARIFGVKKFVYVSSGAVYGERSDIPDEDASVSPGDIYGAAKASSELIGLQYAREFALDFRVGRVYFAYGPGRFPSELYPLYTAVFGCLEGLSRIRLGAGKDQDLDFTYVKDVAQAILLLYERESVGHRVYNISSGVSRNIVDIIKLANRYAGLDLDIDIGPGKAMPRGPSLDISRIRLELGFIPHYTLERGLEEYYQWIQEAKAHRPAGLGVSPYAV